MVRWVEWSLSELETENKQVAAKTPHQRSIAAVLWFLSSESKIT